MKWILYDMGNSSEFFLMPSLILDSMINETLSSNKKHPIDVQIYDYKQCFDGLWLEECLNDSTVGD